MAEKKQKRVKCRGCGERYLAFFQRCPSCEEPNPNAPRGGVTATDRWIGLGLIVFGALIAIPVVFLFLFMPGIRGRMAMGSVALIPLGMILHGILFTVGIHPKDFWAWWHSLSDLGRALIYFVLALIVIGLVIAWMFSE